MDCEKNFCHRILKNILSWDRIFLAVLSIVLLTLFGIASEWKSYLYLLVPIVAVLVYFFKVAAGIMKWIFCAFLAFVYFLIVWLTADWAWIFFPVLLLLAGFFYIVDSLRVKYGLPATPRWSKGTIGVLSIFIFVVFQILDIVGSRTLSQAILEAKQKGYPVETSKLQEIGKYDKIQDDQNGGTILQECGKILKARFEKWDEKYKRSSASMAFWKTKLGLIDYEKKWNEKEMAEAKSLLDSCSDVLTAMDVALSMPERRIPVVFPKDSIDLFETELPHYKNFQACMEILILKSFYFQNMGQEEKAAQAIIDIFKAAETLDQDPFLISHIWKMQGYKHAFNACIHFLNNLPKHNPEILKKLQSKISVLCSYSNTNIQWAMSSELCFAISFGKELKTSFAQGLLTRNKYSLGIVPFIPRGWLRIDLTHMVREEMKVIDMCLQPENVFRDLLKEYRFLEPSHAYVLTCIMTPALKKMLTSNFRYLTLARCSWAALDLKIQESQTGKMPENFGYVVPDNRNNIADPFTGKNLCYHANEKGYLVYGTGEDESDDGGQIGGGSGSKDVGIFLPR